MQKISSKTFQTPKQGNCSRSYYRNNMNTNLLFAEHKMKKEIQLNLSLQKIGGIQKQLEYLDVESLSALILSWRMLDIQDLKHSKRYSNVIAILTCKWIFLDSKWKIEISSSSTKSDSSRQCMGDREYRGQNTSRETKEHCWIGNGKASKTRIIGSHWKYGNRKTLL